MPNSTRHRSDTRKTGHGKFAGLNKFTPQRVYAYVRKFQPDVIVETGVCNGASTLVVLRALERNDAGQLHSIDLPDEMRLPEDRQPGWIVPDSLHEQWTLTLGNSLEELPDVLADLEEVELFMHDTTTQILDDELSIVWPHLSTDGMIFADDIHSNRMFDEITSAYAVDSGHVAPNVGYFRKRA
ncbi:MAG: class I SAM-dependent methyltransferase [Halovenus sp.]